MPENVCPRSALWHFLISQTLRESSFFNQLKGFSERTLYWPASRIFPNAPCRQTPRRIRRMRDPVVGYLIDWPSGPVYRAWYCLTSTWLVWDVLVWLRSLLRDEGSVRPMMPDLRRIKSVDQAIVIAQKYVPNHYHAIFQNEVSQITNDGRPCLLAGLKASGERELVTVYSIF